MKWIRLYTEVLNDPKVQQLSTKTSWFWINLLCMAGELESDGDLPTVKEIAFRLRMKAGQVSKLLSELEDAGLVERDGETRILHNWTLRQPPSDNSRPRVQALRARRGNADVTPGPPLQDRDGHGTDQTRGEETRGEETRGEENRTDQSGAVTDPSGRAAEPPSLEQAEQAFLDAPPNEQVARLIDLGDVHGFNRSKGLTASLIAEYGHDPPGIVEAMRVTAAKRDDGKLEGSPWKYAKGVMKRNAEDGSKPIKRPAGKASPFADISA